LLIELHRGDGTMAATFCRSKDDPAAANPATTLLTFALDFHRKESVCGGHGATSLNGSLLSPGQRRLASAGHCADLASPKMLRKVIDSQSAPATAMR
jgi:hypothetical protein